MDDSVVKIFLHGTNKIVGAGVLLGPLRIATCAHVVNFARGRPSDTQERPQTDEMISVGFPVDRSTKFSARLIGDADWSPPPQLGSSGRDLCVLHLDEKPPHGARVARAAITVDGIESKPFRAIGYPPGWPDGDAAEGEIVLKAGNLFYLRPREPLQAMVGAFLSALMLRRPAGLIYGGFSGGPVEVEGKVGLVTRGRRRYMDVTAQMVVLSAHEQKPQTDAARTPLGSLRPRPWVRGDGSATYTSTSAAVEAWIAQKNTGPLVLLDHFDVDLDSTYAEVSSLQHFENWAQQDVSVDHFDHEGAFAPYTIVSLESRPDANYPQEELAGHVSNLATQLRKCEANVVILCSRSIFRWEPLRKILRGFPYLLRAGPLYSRGGMDLLAPDTRAGVLALYISANSPSLANIAYAIQKIARGRLPALRQLADRALSDGLLDAAVRAEIALAVTQRAPIQRHKIRGIAYPPLNSNGPAEVYTDVGEIDSVLRCADLVGPIGSGKSNVLRDIERRLVLEPSRNPSSAFVTPVWLPLYVPVGSPDERTQGGPPALLDYLRERVAHTISVGTDDNHELVGLRGLLSNATLLSDLGEMISSPILFLLDVSGPDGLRIARDFVAQIRSTLPSAGYIVAHEDAGAALTDHVVHMAPPDLATVTAVLGCSEDAVFEALCASGDAQQVLTNWSLLKMLADARGDSSWPYIDAKALIERHFETLLDDPGLRDSTKRSAFVTWCIQRSPDGPPSQFESIARRLGLFSSNSEASIWIDALLMARRWHAIEKTACNVAVCDWLDGEEHGFEAPTLLCRLISHTDAAGMLHEIAKKDLVLSLRFLNHLPRELARAIDQLGKISEEALETAMKSLPEARSATQPSSIIRALSRHDPRTSLPPKIVQYEFGNGTPASIGAFPVTRSQFEEFVRDRGYQNAAFWDQDREFFGHARSSGLAAKRLWDLTTRGVGNAPMTDVALPEAAAFCRWLTHKYDDIYALPTAAQWDAAAEMSGRVLSAALTKPSALPETRISSNPIAFRASRSWQAKAETPVGLGTPSQSGCYDLFGLVWEWCDSWAQTPHPDTPPSKNPGETRTSVVLRGCPRPRAASLFDILGGQLAPTASMSNLGFRVFCIQRISRDQGRST